MSWRDGIDRWPRALPSFDIDTDHLALLLIDVQNYLCRQDCGIGRVLQEQYPELAKYYFPKLTNEIIPNNERLLTLFRMVDRPVVFLTFGPNLPDGKDLRNPRRTADKIRQSEVGRKTVFPVGAFEHQVVEPLTPQPGELVLNKVTSSGFISTGLDQVLRNLGVTDLIVTGVLTNGCVESTITGAADRGYRVLLVEDACGSFERTAHEATLRNFARLRGLVEPTDLVFERLSTLRTEISTNDN